MVNVKDQYSHLVCPMHKITNLWKFGRNWSQLVIYTALHCERVLALNYRTITRNRLVFHVLRGEAEFNGKSIDQVVIILWQSTNEMYHFCFVYNSHNPCLLEFCLHSKQTIDMETRPTPVFKNLSIQRGRLNTTIVRCLWHDLVSYGQIEEAIVLGTTLRIVQ